MRAEGGNAGRAVWIKATFGLYVYGECRVAGFFVKYIVYSLESVEKLRVESMKFFKAVWQFCSYLFWPRWR